MKKLNKILISLAMVLMFALPLLLTGCGASSEEIGRITIASARNFVEKHEDYSNYKNITYRIKYNYDTTSKRELEYKERMSDSEYKTGSFEIKEKMTADMTISVKKMDDEDLALYIKIKEDTSREGFDVDEEDCLERISGSTSATTEYIFSFDKDEEENKLYYIVKTHQGLDNSKKEITYQECSAALYVEYIENILQKTKECAMNSVFFTSSIADGAMSEFLSTMVNYSEKNGVVTTSMSASMPYASVEYAMFYDMSVSSSYSKGSLKSAKADMTMIQNENKMKALASLNISNSANGTFKLPSLEEAKELDEVFNAHSIDIPENIMNIMGD